MMRIDIQKEAQLVEEQRRDMHPKLSTASFRVSNANVFGKSLAQLNVRSMTGAVVSRVKSGNKTIIPVASTVLLEGDLIKAVGNEQSLEQLAILMGERVDIDLPLGTTQELQSLLLTNKEIINNTLGFLNLQGTFGCTVTRVRRSGIDLSPEPNLVLKFGDKLMVAGERESVKQLGHFIGNDEKRLSDTDFFPIAAGIVLGILFGKLSLSFSDSFSFSFGLTGGILMVALILSAIGKTGPIVWTMSGAGNQLLRQLGLLLFLAEVGTSAGVNLVSTFQESGLTLFGVGIAVTLLPMIIATLVGHFIFKINILDLIGTLAEE
jgi:putative transport protein